MRLPLSPTRLEERDLLHERRLEPVAQGPPSRCLGADQRHLHRHILRSRTRRHLPLRILGPTKPRVFQSTMIQAGLSPNCTARGCVSRAASVVRPADVLTVVPFNTPFTTQPKLPDPSTADGPSHILRGNISRQNMGHRSSITCCLSASRVKGAGLTRWTSAGEHEAAA